MNIYNVIILDESGSMSSIYEATLDSMNEVLSGIRKNQEEFPEENNFVTIVTFEGQGISGIKTRRDRVPIEAVAPFTEADYRPGGCTPLYDAMGKTLNELEGLVHAGDRVIATIITDGYENASEEYSGKTIVALVDRLREKGWTLAYIGANHNSVEVARDLHINNAIDFLPTGEGVAVMKVRLNKARTKSSRLWQKLTDVQNHSLEDIFNDMEEPDK